MIRLDSVTKIYHSSLGTKSLVAVEGVSMEVGRREFVSVLGPSGCGKTTLLKLIGGVESPTAGRILVDDGDPARARQRRAFGFVFQEPVLLDWRTVFENVRLPGEIFGQVPDRAEVQHYIQLVGLRGFEHAYPRQLSGGMQSRVAIARALSFQPSILLMDEPFGDLDEITRTRMNLELLRIWETTNATVVFVTHSIQEAVFLSDRVVVLGAQPGHIESIVEIGLPRPRAIDFLDQPEFLRFTRELRQQMHLTNNAPEALHGH